MCNHATTSCSFGQGRRRRPRGQSPCGTARSAVRTERGSSNGSGRRAELPILRLQGRAGDCDHSERNALVMRLVQTGMGHLAGKDERTSPRAPGGVGVGARRLASGTLRDRLDRAALHDDIGSIDRSSVEIAGNDRSMCGMLRRHDPEPELASNRKLRAGNRAVGNTFH
jgi:hypothetical protein